MPDFCDLSRDSICTAPLSMLDRVVDEIIVADSAANDAANDFGPVDTMRMPISMKAQRILIVASPSNCEMDRFGSVLPRTLKRAGIDHVVSTPDGFNDLLAQSTCVALAALDLQNVSRGATEQLFDYVVKGGGLVILMDMLYPWLAKLTGLKHRETVDDFTEAADSGTFCFVGDLFPGVLGLEFPSYGSRPLVRARISSYAEVEPVIETGAGELIAWRRVIGAGRIFCWNTELFQQSNFTGLSLQSILSCQPVSAATIANAGVVQVDDFPAGFTEQHLEPVAADQGLSLLEFLDKVWLPDILELSRKFQLPLSFFMVFNYNDKTKPPFDFAEWESARYGEEQRSRSYALKFCRQAAEAGELGLHGYNHVPLTCANWGESRHMQSVCPAGGDGALEKRWIGLSTAELRAADE